MDLGISGRVALVTGASKGLGRAIAETLIAEGARTAISSSSAERIAQTAGEIGATPFTHDARDAEAAAPLAAAIEAELGPIEILVTNSGGPPANPDALSFTREQWQAAYETLVLGQIALIEAVLPGMRARGHGRIISISSSVVREPSEVLMLSTAHRSGLLAALKTIARQVAPDGVTVNTLLPGLIATDRTKQLGAESPERVATIPARRLGTPQEFAAAAVFLASAQAAYITGTTLLIDGGASRAI